MPTKVRTLLLLIAGLLAMTGSIVRGGSPPPDMPGPLPPGSTITNPRLGFGMPSMMTPNPGPGMPFEMDDSTHDTGEKPSSNNEWVIAPIPFISPLVGFGLAAGVGYIYRPPGEDVGQPPWVSGIGGFYSDNHSWALALGHKMYLDHDQWRLFGLAGYGVLNYDFYGIGPGVGDRKVSLNQTVNGINGEALYRVADHLYVGLNYSFAQVDTRYGGGNLPPQISNVLTGDALSAVLSNPSLRIQWDTRNSTFFPTQGWLIDGEAVFSDETFGSDFNYQALSITARHYWSLSDTQTVAVYGWGRFAFGDVPFFALSMIGAKGNLRGYPVGRYQDLMAMTGQIEYRWQAWRRVGVVAFGGVGAVAPDLEGFRHTKALPSVGGGLRYLLSEKNHLNFRLDVSWGRDERLVYLGVGEAF